MKSYILLALTSSLALAACDQNYGQQTDYCPQSRDPAQCYAMVQAGGDSHDYLLYGLAGFMLGRMSNGQQTIYRDPGYNGPSRYYADRVIHHTVIIDRSPAANARYAAVVSQYRSTGSLPVYSGRSVPSVNVSKPQSYVPKSTWSQPSYQKAQVVYHTPNTSTRAQTVYHTPSSSSSKWAQPSSSSSSRWGSSSSYSPSRSSYGSSSSYSSRSSYSSSSRSSSSHH